MSIAPIPARKLPMDAVLALLSSGFDAQVASLSQYYGVTMSSIDFSDSSSSFALQKISDQNIELCRLTEFNPLAGCLFTGACTNNRTLFGYRFDGPVEVYIRWWIRSREGTEGFDTESILNIAEDATNGLLEDPTVKWPPGVIYGHDAQAERSDVFPLSEGWGQYATIACTFEVCII